MAVNHNYYNDELSQKCQEQDLTLAIRQHWFGNYLSYVSNFIITFKYCKACTCIFIILKSLVYTYKVYRHRYNWNLNIYGNEKLLFEFHIHYSH